MIVIDASAMLEFLLQTPLGLRVEARLFKGDDVLLLSEALDAPLVTCDGPLARTPGHRARIEVID